MSGRRAEGGKKSGKSQGRSSASGKAQTAAGVQFGPPLRPQPKLFVILCVVFALWVIGLIVMYFTTVYPYRHH